MKNNHSSKSCESKKLNFKMESKMGIAHPTTFKFTISLAYLKKHHYFALSFQCESYDCLVRRF